MHLDLGYKTEGYELEVAGCHGGLASGQSIPQATTLRVFILVLGHQRGVWCGVVWCAEGAVTHRQRAGCLAHGKLQNGWALNLNPKSECKPCVLQAWDGSIYRARGTKAASCNATVMLCRVA